MLLDRLILQFNVLQLLLVFVVEFFVFNRCFVNQVLKRLDLCDFVRDDDLQLNIQIGLACELSLHMLHTLNQFQDSIILRLFHFLGLDQSDLTFCKLELRMRLE